MRLLVSILLLWVSPSLFAQELSLTWKTLEGSDNGPTLHYAVSHPIDFDPQEEYPVLLALPGGPQTKGAVLGGFRRYWGLQAKERDWIVVSPQAPPGQLFFTGAERLLPRLLRQIRIDYRVESNRIHLVGSSTGGQSAFHVALQWPWEFLSLTVLPGFVSPNVTKSELKGLRHLDIHLFAGETDRDWVKGSRKTVARLEELGISAPLTVFEGEGHAPRSLDNEALMEHLDKLHEKTRLEDSPRARVDHALNDFHDAATKGDGERYFSRFAPEGVFLGTDGGERWTLDTFWEFASPYFDGESAWIYIPQERHITLDPSGTVAWFDEVLVNASYGSCRGTGVLREMDGKWRLSQYNLTIPVPNELASTLVGLIRSGARPPASPTRVFLVRHAEKKIIEGERDPPLTEKGTTRAHALARVLGSFPIDAIYASQFKRTQWTVAPLAHRFELEPMIVDARKVRELAAKILEEHEGQHVVIAGHSNTVPALIRALGVEASIEIDEKKGYDDLFVVEKTAFGTRLIHWHYGPNPGD